jgi:hypothetical protein
MHLDDVKITDLSQCQVAGIIRGIGPEFCTYGDVIEREQIDGVMLSSLMQEGLNDLLVCRQLF